MRVPLDWWEDKSPIFSLKVEQLCLHLGYFKNWLREVFKKKYGLSQQWGGGLGQVHFSLF